MRPFEVGQNQMHKCVIYLCGFLVSCLDRHTLRKRFAWFDLQHFICGVLGPTLKRIVSRLKVLPEKYIKAKGNQTK